VEDKQDLIPAHQGRKSRGGGKKTTVRREAAFMMPCRIPRHTFLPPSDPQSKNYGPWRVTTLD